MPPPPFDKEQAIHTTVDQVRDFAHLLPLIVIVHELPEMHIRYLSDFGLRLIGITRTELDSMSYDDFLSRFMNVEHFQEVSDKLVAMLSSDQEDAYASYFQQVRTEPRGDFDWYLSTTRVLLRHPDRTPLLIITTAMMIDRENPFVTKAQRILQENEFIKKH